MAYRNKTFVSFASEDIHCYYLMKAWKQNENIDFDFYDAHDLNTALDSSQPETIKRRLRERLANTKQVVMLIGDSSRKVSDDTGRFFHYEAEVIERLELPVVFANLNGSRKAQSSRVPRVLLSPYTISTSFGPKIIQYALDEFPPAFAANLQSTSPKTGLYQYKDSVYQSLGL